MSLNLVRRDPMSTLSRLAAFCALAIPLLVSPVLRAAGAKPDSQKDAEAKQAAEEEAAESKLDGEDPKKSPRLYGKLLLAETKENEKPEVIGWFTVGDHQYQLKVSDDTLRQELKRYDGKSLCLEGKIRNDGKYFIAGKIFGGGGAPPVQLRNPEGL
jgi:hypothetical protein